MKQNRLTRRQKDLLLYCLGGVTFWLVALGAAWLLGAAYHALFTLLGVA